MMFAQIPTLSNGKSHDVTIEDLWSDDLTIMSFLPPTNELLFYVNGQRITIHNPDVETTLVEYLRNHLALTGTKLGCDQGGCGACTVMLSQIDLQTKSIRHMVVNSCLILLCSLHGQAVTTVEGVGSTRTRLDSVQRAISGTHGSQCGFCTPGFVMSMFALLRNDPCPTMEVFGEALTGNICRCTGYRAILEGFKGMTMDYCCIGTTKKEQVSETETATSSGLNTKYTERLFTDSMNVIHNENSLESGYADSNNKNNNGKTLGHHGNNSDRCLVENGISQGKRCDCQLIISEKIDQNGKCSGSCSKLYTALQCLNQVGDNARNHQTNYCKCSGFRSTDVEDIGEFVRRDCSTLLCSDRAENRNAAVSKVSCSASCQDNEYHHWNNGCRSINRTIKKFSPVRDKCRQPDNVVKERLHNNTTQCIASRCAESQEVIFPTELQQQYEKITSEYLVFKTDQYVWHRPTNLRHLLEIMATNPAARLTAGNTELRFQLKNSRPTHQQLTLISISSILELLSHKVTDSAIRIGAAVMLSDVEKLLKEMIPTMKESTTRYFSVMIEAMRCFTSQQIKNTSTIGGHILSSGSASNLNPVFQVTGCVLEILSAHRGRRLVKMDQYFFAKYRKTLCSSGAVLISVEIPFSNEDEHVVQFQQTRRKQDGVTNMTSAMRVLFEKNSITIKDISLSFGGIAPNTVMAVETSKSLNGCQWNEEFLIDACQMLTQELQLTSLAADDKTTAYKNCLISSFFFKFYLMIRIKLEQKYPELCSKLTPDIYRSAAEMVDRKIHVEGIQVYEMVNNSQVRVDAVGLALPHVSSQLHATGEAIYVDDIPSFKNEIHLSLVTSASAHARILNVDASEALRMIGVIDFISKRDVRGDNRRGVIFRDEEVFCTDVVRFEGQAIGGILADSRGHARQAAKAVQITYEPLPVISTIEDAISLKSFLDNHPPLVIHSGNVDNAMRFCDHVICGNFYVGGQKHFYMETQTCLVVPKCENGELEVFSSTQNNRQVQLDIASALDVECNKIVCRVKRIGGGFGGKEIACVLVAVPTAIAAQKHGRPVRCTLRRDEDMRMVGGRHAMLAKYRVGFNNDGRIISLDVQLFGDAGYSHDLSTAVMNGAVSHIDNAYRIPNVRIEGRLCRTNLPSSTAFRGFGTPQAVLICENIITEVAHRLRQNPKYIRELNMYKEGELTHYNQPVFECTLTACWNELIRNCDYERRKAEVDEFNRKNRWRKRGICLVPVKQGLAFQWNALNQAGALVNIYIDGSVLISHGGIEMGQGLHTKMIQCASRALQLPVDRINVMETSTACVPNASQTAASTSSDLNGMAVVEACRILVERLEPYRKAHPEQTWNDWISQAYLDRVCLSAVGFYKVDELNYDWKTNTGQKYLYFSMGAACSEVEIDCLTGDHTLLRTDIVMDVGKSINPAIDIGQIEGGFVQGYGLFVTEQVKYSRNGLLYSKEPATYMIPRVGDIPQQFNVTLLKGSLNSKAVYSSKGIGEPPLVLAASVFFAIREAVESARSDGNLDHDFTFNSPAAAEQIRLSCSEQFNNKFDCSDTLRHWRATPK